MSLGALAGGLLAHAFGLRAPLVIAGAVRVIALAAMLPILIREMRVTRVKV